MEAGQDLLDGKSIIRFIFVEGAYHPIAPWPDIAVGIFFETESVRIPGKIQPDCRPTLTVGRGGRQSVDDFFTSRLNVDFPFRFKLGKLGNSRRKTCQIEGDPPQPLTGCRWWGWRKARLFDSGENESVEGNSGPIGLFQILRLPLDRFLKCPMLLPPASFTPPWQEVQCFRKIGRTSRLKWIFSADSLVSTERTMVTASWITRGIEGQPYTGKGSCPTRFYRAEFSPWIPRVLEIGARR